MAHEDYSAKLDKIQKAIHELRAAMAIETMLDKLDPTQPAGKLRNTFALFAINGLLGEVMDWDAWMHGKDRDGNDHPQIPWIHWPQEWAVRAIPPFGGQLIRYSIKQDDAFVSIYFDSLCVAGAMQAPYWEIYPVPYVDDDGVAHEDVGRYMLGEEDEMLAGIRESIDHQLQHGRPGKVDIKEVTESLRQAMGEMAKEDDGEE